MVRVVLWDADGVLQHSVMTDGATSWQAALDAAGGPGFAEAVFSEELPALRGEEPLRAGLERVLAAWPEASVTVDQLIGLWEQARVDPAAMALVDELRASGVQCVLATNQQDHRRAWMRDVLGYDTHFDRVFYSCEMGVMKPNPQYFQHILDELEVPAHEVGFIDDSAANVAAARSVGIHAVRHDPESGAEQLRVEAYGLL